MPNVKKIIQLRQTVLQALRKFFFRKNYYEVDTPSLAPAVIPESYVELFETQIKDVKGTASPAYLLASPEAYLKKLLVEGSGNIFYLGKAFRNNEPVGHLHNHEFTILEWYKLKADYKQLMKEIEQMITYVAKQLAKTLGIKAPLKLTRPWECITVEQAFQRFVPKDIIPETETVSQQDFEKFYVQYLEPNLGTRGKPTFIADFPAWQSPLAKTRGQIAERFELYINGVELINGWTELTNWQKQLKNLQLENNLRQKYGKKPLPIDYGFIQSLKKGMPECAGAAMGVDRLIMVLAGYKKLTEVILFPSMLSSSNTLH